MTTVIDRTSDCGAAAMPMIDVYSATGTFADKHQPGARPRRHRS